MRISRLAVILLCTLMLAACRTDAPPASDTSPATSVPETTAAPETELVIPANRVPIAKKNLKHTDAGLRPMTITSSNRLVAEGETGNRVTYIYAYGEGTTTLSFTDCFGHTASCDVTVSGGEITLTPHPPAEDFIEPTLDYGAYGYDTTDDTEAIQKALDAAKPGETVYLYPGTYVVGTLVMREGITLEMYTTMTDATAGFTDKLARQTAKGEITVLSGVRIMNNAHNQPGAEGCSNFTIRGGVLDQKETSRGAIIFGKADGVLMENVILKDVKNNHAVQLTGCTNTTLRNCMFAGYTWGGTFTREVVQVEPSHPGATGTAETAPLTFQNGEFYYCENIEISHCYFGKSDKCGAPLMAIGHHSQGGTANVTGFRITDCVFDEMMYAGIRYANLVDTEISGNTFISTAAYPNVKDSQATTPACIIIYSTTSTTSYTSILSGQTITVADGQEQSGTHNLRITNNTFRIGEGSDKRIFHIVGTTCKPGFRFRSFVRQDAYNTPHYRFNGYTTTSNFIDNITFAENTIVFEGQPTYRDYFLYAVQLRRLTIENNTVEAPTTVTFSAASGDLVGAKVTGSAAETYSISTGPIGKILLESTGEKITLKANNTYTVTIKAEGGGYLAFSDDGKGNGIITPVPDDGFVFDGLYASDGSRITGDYTVTATGAMTARFTAK